MPKKIVNKDYSISGLDVMTSFKQYWVYKRMPFVNIAEGTNLKVLYQLFLLHNVGYWLVRLELKNPGLYRILNRVRNSLVFRYNHYRGQLNRKFFKK